MKETMVSRLPETIKAPLRLLRTRLSKLGEDSTPISRDLTKYFIEDSTIADWSPDHSDPKGVIEDYHYKAHSLLAKAVLQLLLVNSWCDLGTGVASLPLAVAKLGLDDVLALDGTDIAVGTGLVKHTSGDLS